MEQFPDYYNIIRVPTTASAAEVRRAYRKRALEIHPDVNPTPDATARFKELNQAYHVLGDPVRRSLYDSLRASTSAKTAPVIALSRREKFRLIVSAMGTVMQTP